MFDSSLPTTLHASGSTEKQADRPEFIYCKNCGRKHPENTYRCVQCETLLHSDPASHPTVALQEDGLGMILPAQNPFSLWAYYTGMFSFIPVIGVPLAIIAIATGIMGIHRYRSVKGAKGILHSVCGLLFGLFSILSHWVVIYVMKHVDLSHYFNLLNA